MIRRSGQRRGNEEEQGRACRSRMQLVEALNQTDTPPEQNELFMHVQRHGRVRSQKRETGKHTLTFAVQVQP